MASVRPHHVALGASGAITCMMVGLLLGILASGGHISRILSVVHSPASPANAAVRHSDIAATPRAASGPPTATITVTHTASPRTVTAPGTTTTKTTTTPATTVTQTVTTTVTQPITSTSTTSTP